MTPLFLNIKPVAWSAHGLRRDTIKDAVMYPWTIGKKDENFFVEALRDLGMPHWVNLGSSLT
jgi:hypothetical protein